ncbi:putative phage-associated protein [Bradyrhizobium elkanii]|uniref:Panacea domain-containing protein n=1 Tax=Bradyrhizobium elkanii TaxID=29448 RepID=UPI0022273032|nr:type II toxin-antitoxin system antitoxin SocA domain-containing protein [Bradyrhizobium elkanii]MCW2130191.1 putative phage-associated protein [Bradyrhizobium elkanii]MCW2167868.1 putative phage-associated protein [Bradyrhizobium elkanii]
MYKGKSIANAFLLLANRDSASIDPLKLQKLIYFANGYYMAENDGHPLVNEYFEAWDYGPVVPTVYYEFREYRNSSIARLAYTWDARKGRMIPAPPPIGDEGANDIIGWVWENYKGYSGGELSHMTHKSEGPWDLARRRAKNSGMRNERLELADIKRYFEQLTSNDAAA